MNERIRELATEAEDYADGIVDKGGEFHETYTKKFAELIVQDTLKVIAEVGYKSSNDIPFEITELFERMVKRHFGVE
jgi:hypothetical protein